MRARFKNFLYHPTSRLVLAYSFMLVTVGLFVWLKLTILQGLSPEAPYLFILFSVFISAFYGGFGPGVVATLISIVAIFYYFLEPQYQFELLYLEDFEIIITYIMVGFAFSWLLDQQRQIKSDLEAMVEHRTAQLRNTNQELKRSNQELQDFAYIASHDLQEPLRKILAFGDRLKAKHAQSLSNDAKHYLTRMLSSAERMRQLVESLLRYARVTNTKTPATKVALNGVIEAVIDDMELAIEEANAQIEVGNLPMVEAIKPQLCQVFQNLLSNSIKFRHPDRTAVVTITGQEVQLALNGKNGEIKKYAKINFNDNGIGIATEYQQKIFNIFQRLHGRAKYDGTGIGLAVVRRIIERHNGKIAVSSVEGEGTSFEILLPISQVSSVQE